MAFEDLDAGQIESIGSLAALNENGSNGIVRGRIAHRSPDAMSFDDRDILWLQAGLSDHVNKKLDSDSNAGSRSDAQDLVTVENYTRESSIFRVDGIVAVITGGGSGVGLSITRALAANGAHKIHILGRRPEVLKKAAAKYPNVITPHQADVTSKQDLQAAVDRVKSEVGYVNLVVANSGSIGPPVRLNPTASLPDLRQSLFTDFSMDGMNDTLNLNITAAFFTMTAFLKLLDAGTQNALKGGFGKPLQEGSDVPSIQSQVIFTTSISAFSRHWTSSPPYLTSKVAIMQVAKHASTQLARFGIL